MPNQNPTYPSIPEQPGPATVADRLSTLLSNLSDSQFFLLDTPDGDAIYRLALGLERLNRLTNQSTVQAPPPVKKAGRPKGSKNKVTAAKVAVVTQDAQPAQSNAGVLSLEQYNELGRGL